MSSVTFPLYFLGDVDNQRHDRQCPDNGSHGQRHLSHIPQTAQCHTAHSTGQQYHTSHSQARSRTDAQHRRSCQRITEHRLHLQTADRKPRSRHQCRQGLRHTAFPKNIAPDNFLVAHRIGIGSRSCPPQQFPYLAKRDMDGTQQQVQQKEQEDGCQYKEHQRQCRSFH